MRSRTRRSFLLALPVLLLAAPAALAKPPTKTHLGAAPSDVVTLITAVSPTQPGETAPLGYQLPPSGTPVPFALPPGTVLVVTDVSVTIPSSAAPQGRYVAAICNTPCLFGRVDIQIDTSVDGFQKTIALTGGVVFGTLPQFFTLDDNPAATSVLVHGYLAKDK